MALSCSWSNLPQEILKLIFDKLDNCMDVLRCGYVCVSWRMAVTEVYHTFIPLLLIINYDDTTTLFNISTKESLIIHLPEINGRWICGSTNGWLVTIGFAWPHGIHLLNPLSRVQIDLPFISKFEFPDETSIVWLVESYIKRAITSTSPLDPDCVVFVVYGVDYYLAFCRPGDERWTDFNVLGIVDIMFHKGQFYATDKFGNIVCWEIDPNPVAVLIVNTAEYEPGKKYLVESLSGDFWLVLRNHNWEADEDDGNDLYESLKTSFEVFKLDMSTMEWREVKTLGDQALFLGRNGSISVSTRNSRALLRGNCIYFIDNSKGGGFETINGFNYLMAYDMENKHMEQLYHSEYWRSQFHWITPDI